MVLLWARRILTVYHSRRLESFGLLCRACVPHKLHLYVSIMDWHFPKAKKSRWPLNSCLCRSGKTVREVSWLYKHDYKNTWPFTNGYGKELTFKEVLQWHATSNIKPRAWEEKVNRCLATSALCGPQSLRKSSNLHYKLQGAGNTRAIYYFNPTWCPDMLHDTQSRN